MSSRRKSRPVRRLDNVPTVIDLQENVERQLNTYDDQQSEQSLSTPCESPQDNVFVNSVERNSNSDEEQDDANELKMEEAKKRLENPPEGVYIVQPQSVSDDEVSQEGNTMATRPRQYDMKDYQNEQISSKKRHLEQENGAMEEFHDDLKRDGLDLSVKKRKHDEDSYGNPEEVTSPREEDQDVNDELTVHELQDILPRYEKLFQLLAKQRPLAESMQEVGLTQRDIIIYQKYQLQMMGNTQRSNEINQMEDYQARQDEADSSSQWHDNRHSGAMEAWQRKHEIEGNQRPSVQKPAFNSSSLPISPAVVAAMMASLVSNNEKRNSEETSNSDMVQNMFKQNQKILLQQVSSSSKTSSNGQYATSADAIDTITAGTVSSGVGSIKKGTLDPTNFDEEVFDKYISRFSSKNPCMQSSCPHINRDHFHCTDSDCNFQRFTNKSDVIRHYNMHKKRDNSLAHGFMRFAPTDSCVNQFGQCHLNGKSTHYHCLHPNCTKVYTSTSDVMTHENFHKKNQHFVTNGFQRYRATEPCEADYCPFKNQRTTHFHCTRSDCNFTFKNKCDIEKHKIYHMRDDAYARQGFKKFYKNEPCQFPSCPWNRTANHFHCLRQNCDFSFTSTSQMVSHKRKHDRQDYMGAEQFDLTSSQNAATSSCETPLPQASPAVPSFSGLPRRLANPFLRPSISPYLSIRGPHPNLIPSLSFLSPFVAANLLRRPSPTVQHDPRSSGIGKYDNFVFNEAAKKVLSGVPVSLAAAGLPQNLATFSPKLDPANLQAALTSATSSTVTTSGAEIGFHARTGSQVDASSDFERPPPPYIEVPESMSNRNSPRFENDRYHDDNDNSDQERWGVTSQHSQISPGANKRSFPGYGERRVDNETDDSQALNLSGKVPKPGEISLQRKSSVIESSGNPSAAVLKFFRGFVPDECVVSNCIFMSRHHFHCVVKECCAVFADKILVLNHTAFHDKLEKMGVPQSNAEQFPPRFPPTSRSDSSRDPNSPPPGYIALPVTNRSKDFDLERRNAFVNRPSIKTEPITDSREIYRQQSQESSAEVKSSFLQEKLMERLANGFQDARKTTVYDYLSRKMAENNTATSYPSAQGVPPASSSAAYVMLQNPSVMASIVGNQQKSLQPPTSSARSNDSIKRFTNSSLPQQDGYIHVRAGMTCIRSDCKYILQTHWHCTINRCRYVCKSLAKAQSHREAHDSLEAYARAAKECFRSYTVKKNCPNPNCEFRMRGHYHCLKPGCQFVTIGTSKLPWHMKKHEKIARREAKGFKYYTKKEQCGKQDCKYNDRFSHYHCVRPGCSFAFQYKHQMSTHVRKHLRRMLGRSDAQYETGDVDHTNVDSGDDSLPLIVDEADELEQRPGVSMETAQPALFQHRLSGDPTQELSQQQLAVLEQISRGRKSSLASGNEHMPGMENIHRSISETELMQDDDNMDYLNDDSSNDEVLDLRANNAQDTDSNSAGSSIMGSASEQQFVTNGNEKMENEDNAPLPQVVVSEGNETFGFSKNNERTTESGAMFNKFRLNNDVVSGFKRFETSENCGDTQCSYTFKVSHYHCLQEGCNYRFTGRTHMFKHQQHHERVANLVRDDFKRFKPTQDCEQADCPHNGNGTHFHCLRCDFKCTDSAKVGTHRRQHIKADTLEQSGFERFRGKEDCKRDNCRYREKNTSHFHCLQEGCSYAVVGLSSIEQHNRKHQKNQSSSSNAHLNFSIFAKQLIRQADSSSTSFANSSIPGTPTHLASFSVPFSALSSTPTAAVRGSDASSPVTDDRSSVSPPFNASVVTSQFDASIMQDKSEPESVDLSSTRDLPVSHDIPTQSMTSLQAGASL